MQGFAKRILTVLLTLSIGLLASCSSGRSSRNDAVVEGELGPSDLSTKKALVDESDLVKVHMSAPEELRQGEDYTLDMTVEALQDVSHVHIFTHLPNHAEHLSSTPEARVNAGIASWFFLKMYKGQKENLSLTMKAPVEGHYIACTAVEALPLACISTFAGKPQLQLIKTGPEQVLVGEELTYEVTVANRGTLTARDVKVTDLLPEGLSHSSGKSELEFAVGDLEPGEQETIDVKVEAVDRGSFCNSAMATAMNTDRVDAQACTEVLLQKLTLVKSGPEKALLGKEAEYQMTLSNDGDFTMDSVTVIDKAPSGTTLVQAPDAAVRDHEARWTLTDFGPGASETFTVRLRGEETGTHCNYVRATASNGYEVEAEACTEWIGHAALLIEVVDTDDPLIVGRRTTYRIEVTNQGTAPDTNVKLVARVPDGLRAVEVSGDVAGEISGQTVTFSPVASLVAGETITVTLLAEAVSEGDHRLMVELSSDLLAKPVVEEESTHVY